jgi:hypothetical protein
LSAFCKKKMRCVHYPLKIGHPHFIWLRRICNSNSLPEELCSVVRFGGEDFGFLSLLAPVLVEPVFCCCRIFVWPEPNLPVVLLQTGLNSAIGLSNINLATLAGRCVHQAITYDVAFGQASINATACGLDMWKLICFTDGWSLNS